MREIKDALVLYVQALERRPSGYTRQSHNANWGYMAWEDILLDGKSECYKIASDLWDTASKLLGISTHDVVDFANSQEISEQFYLLFSDLIQEYIRNTK